MHLSWSADRGQGGGAEYGKWGSGGVGEGAKGCDLKLAGTSSHGISPGDIPARRRQACAHRRVLCITQNTYKKFKKEIYDRVIY